jgi:putative ABC transport system ATP-binding protein
MSSSIAVKTARVTKAFGAGEARILALKEVDFEARTGELLMVVGPSGCGKTTLLSVVAGTLAFESGQIEVFGARLHELKPGRITEFRRANIGFIFQQFHLIPTLTCLENVCVPLLINKVRRSEAEERARLALKIVGIEEKASQRPALLSGGQQQRVAIARALVHEPRLVICDEPTSALDSETGARIMELLTGAARAPGRSVIVVTHDNRAFKYADRMVEMEDGRVIRVSDSAAPKPPPSQN